MGNLIILSFGRQIVVKTKILTLCFFLISTSTALAAETVYVGDSIAQGFKNAANGTGLTKIGASPKTVLEYVKMTSDQKDIVLSTGISNNCNDFKSVEKQFQLLQNANLIVIGNKNCKPEINNKLKYLCDKHKSCKFVPITSSKDGVHPAKYFKLSF